MGPGATDDRKQVKQDELSRVICQHQTTHPAPTPRHQPAFFLSRGGDNYDNPRDFPIKISPAQFSAYKKAIYMVI